MKKSVVIITVVFVLIALSCVCANAEEGEMIYDMSNVFDSLSDDIKQSLQNIWGIFQSLPTCLLKM